MGRPEAPIPGWIRKWMWLTVAIFFMDCLFCGLRPHSLPGGYLAPYFKMYHTYISYEPRYGDTSDSFIFTQTIGSFIEAVLQLVVLLGILKNPRCTKLLAMTANIMVVWKTGLFNLYALEIPKGGYASLELPGLLLVYGTSLPWVVVPAFVAYTLAKDYVEPVPKCD